MVGIRFKKFNETLNNDALMILRNSYFRFSFLPFLIC